MNEMITKASLMLNKAILMGKKHLPEILTFSGLAFTAVGTILAVKSTTKAHEIFEKRDLDLQIVHEAKKLIDDPEEDYDLQTYQQDLTITYTKFAWGLVKLYAPAFIFTALGWAAIISSTNITKQRCVAMAAAYTALDKSFKSYRERVADAVGKEIENDIFRGIKREITSITTIDEDGKEKTEVKETVIETAEHPYTYLYDPINSDNCMHDPNTNIITLTAMEHFYNDRLTAKGYLTLYEVLEGLGFRHLDKRSMIVGWVKHNPLSSQSDGYVSFGITPDSADEGIWLHFNCDGCIYDLMEDAQTY